MSLRLRLHGSSWMALPLLALVALLGYLAGHVHGTAGGGGEAIREVTVSGAVLEYPEASGWRPASGAPAIAGLALTQAAALAPGAEPSHAGLVVGSAAGAGETPLPSALLDRLQRGPVGEVVALENTQAYRYAIPGAGPAGTALTLYAVPGGTAGETVIACYAPASEAVQLRICEGIARTFTRTTPAVGASQEALTPDGAFAARLAGAVARYSTPAASLRTRLLAGSTPHALASAARALEEATGIAVQSLASAQPPAVAEAADRGMVRALWGLHAAYRVLAEAASAESASEYATARARVEAAEAEVDLALRHLALLGYR